MNMHLIAALVVFLLMTMGSCKLYEGNVSQNGKPMGYYFGTVTDQGYLEGYGQYIIDPDQSFNGLKDLAFSYEGEYHHGDRRGIGKFAGKDFVYYGEVDDVPNGKGVGILKDRYWYVGQWKNGVIQGHGTICYINDTVITGFFENSSLVLGLKFQRKQLDNYPGPASIQNGYYTWKVKTGENSYHRFSTLFCNGKPCGEGHFQNFVNEKVFHQYIGQFSSDFPEGKADGFGYQHVLGQYQWFGTWKNDQPNKGIHITSNGVVRMVRIGTWQGWDKFEGKTYTDIKKNLYELRLASGSYIIFLTQLALLQQQQFMTATYILNMQQAMFNARMDFINSLYNRDYQLQKRKRERGY